MRHGRYLSFIFIGCRLVDVCGYRFSLDFDVLFGLAIGTIKNYFRGAGVAFLGSFGKGLQDFFRWAVIIIRASKYFRE